MNKKELKTIAITTEKISNLGDSLLNDEKLQDWEVDKVILTSKSNPQLSVICEWVIVNGKLVKVCRPG